MCTDNFQKSYKNNVKQKNFKENVASCMNASLSGQYADDNIKIITGGKTGSNCQNRKQINNRKFKKNKSGKYDISVVICTYNPDLMKLKRTIKSVFLQNEIDYQIIITDDGSMSFPLDEIIDYFNDYNFENYKICLSDVNHGTVFNTYIGLCECDGEFVKLISPGDYLYGFNTLHYWIDGIQKTKADVSFADSIYYSLENGKNIYHKVKINPQCANHYYHDKWYYNYLIFDDIALGAAVLIKTEVAKKYLKLLLGKIKYAEDNMYRLMAADELQMYYFHRDALLYEYGSGISTSKNNKWAIRLSEDWNATDELISQRITDKKLLTEFNRQLKYRRSNSFVEKLLLLLITHGKLSYKIRVQIYPRFSNTDVDQQYMNRLGN